MDVLHVMLPQDEIFLCGMVLLYGVVIGGVARLIAAWRQRRAA
jgi:hypothetical protein